MAVTDPRLPWAWPDAVDFDAGACRAHPARPGTRLAVRAVCSTAHPDALFLWLCQLQRAPYSYDWIDNFGRRSPRTPDTTMLGLEIGQTFMTIFTLTAFDPGRSLTLQMQPGWPTLAFGAITVRYDIARVSGPRSLLRATLRMPPLAGPLSDQRRYLLAWGDLLMMRKQLRTLSALAAQTSIAAVARNGMRGGKA